MTETITRDGVTFAYDSVGEGAPPVLLIHGMACNRTMWGPQVEHFSRQHRVVAYDQRGHGDSSKPVDGDYSSWGLADDAAWLCGELGLDHPVVVGHSLGGGVATALAARHPDLPSAVVILDSGFEMPDDVRAQLRAFYDALTPDVYDHVVRTFCRERLFDQGDDPDLVASVTDDMASCPREVFLAMGEGVLRFDQAAAATAVTAPTLFIASSRPFVKVQRIHDARPDWYLGRTVGAGHFHHLLVPDQVNGMIDAFLAQVHGGFAAAQPSDY